MQELVPKGPIALQYAYPPLAKVSASEYGSHCPNESELDPMTACRPSAFISAD